jgi:predicted dehydrogenase
MDRLNYPAPQALNQQRTPTSPTARWERVRDRTATYIYQLRAFAAAVLRGEPVITNAEDAVANMRHIDSVYRAAGLPPRCQQGHPRGEPD